jgi:hypothetical protein
MIMSELQDYTIASGETFEVNGSEPVILNFNTFTFEANSTLSVECDLTLNVNTIKADKGALIVSRCNSLEPAKDGTKGTNSTINITKEGILSITNPINGGKGSDGRKGNSCPTIRITAQDVIGDFTLKVDSGNGQDGGDGGKGGDNNNGEVTGGNGGNGADGGNGGNGGNGGDGSSIVFYYKSIEGSINTLQTGGIGGTGGAGGIGGAGLTSGANGNSGRSGKKGSVSNFKILNYMP